MNLDEVICKLECQELMVKFFGTIDSGDIDLWPTLLTDDATMKVPGVPAPFPMSVQAQNMPKNFFPIHLMSNIVITPTSPDTAEGTSYNTAYNIYGSDADAVPREMPSTPNRIGRVIASFRKTTDGWRISAFDSQPPFVDDGKS